MNKIKILILLQITLQLQLATAKDFGRHGAVFAIKEEGFLAMIYRKLQDVNIEEEQQKMQKLAKEQIEEPVKVAGITKATKDRVFIYDPSYTLEEDTVLPDGRVLYPAGTKVNPLDHVSLQKKLIFIDGNDEQQVTWFKKQQIDSYIKEEDKLILTAGRPLDLEKELSREVYFDQSGVLTSKFGIRAVPAIVLQQWKVLAIKEIFID